MFLVLFTLIQSFDVLLVLLKFFYLGHLFMIHCLIIARFKIVIVGNLNLPYFNWSIPAIIGSVSSRLHFLSFLYEHGLSQLNYLPT